MLVPAMQNRGLLPELRLKRKRHPKANGILTQRIPEERWRHDPDDCDRMAIHEQRLAYRFRIRLKSVLPHPIAHHGNGSGIGLVVRRRQCAAGERPDSKHRKVISRDQLGEVLIGNCCIGAADAHRVAGG
jgi:hypothetical protein